MTDFAKRVEEASLNAWPASRQMVFDGWLLRFANGYTRRANSVNPIYTGMETVEQKINFCQKVYSDRQLPCVFKITPFVQPANLDEILAAAGYKQEALTSVQILDLDIGAFEPFPNRLEWAEPVEVWIEDYVRMNSVDSKHIASLTAILNHIVPETCYMSLKEQGSTVACGLAVRDGDRVGLFDIVADPLQRGKGLGQKLMTSLLAWGARQGAKSAYLQVMLHNEAALKLYGKLGFREIYQYWYRVKG
ncbi:MAG: GNAT family N-acetyltransferase [Anaerolineaceae bacterium]|nr:GNAT family N-acetyltransferase [Anaerolineaceae bacterium]